MRRYTITKALDKKKVKEKTAKFWENMFADEGTRKEDKDIWECLGEEAGQEAKKVTDKRGKRWTKI